MNKFLTSLRRRTAFLGSRSGMTMVNIIVAFVVLLVMIGMFVGVVRLAENLIVRADGLRQETEALLEKFYMGDPALEEQTLGSDGNVCTLVATTPGGASSFTMKMCMYSYTYDGTTLYSFGRHSLPLSAP